MKKYMALNDFESRIKNEGMKFEQPPSKRELENVIREISDDN